MFRSNFFKHTKSKLLIAIVMPFIVWFFYYVAFPKKKNGPCKGIECMDKLKVFAGSVVMPVLALPYVILSRVSQNLFVAWISIVLTILYWYLLACLIVFVFKFLKRLIINLKGIKSFKIILFVLAFLVVGSTGYTLGKMDINIAKKSIMKTNDLEQEVRELVQKVAREDTLSFHMDFADPLPGEDPWYAPEQKLVGMGEKVVPILNEVIKENKQMISQIYQKEGIRHNAIYILGRIGGKEAVDSLIAIARSPYEDDDTRAYAILSLGMNKTKNDKALETLTNMVLDKHDSVNDFLQRWAQRALD